MRPLLDVALSEPATALAMAGLLLVLLVWLSWRRPTSLFLLALASLAIRPELLWGGPPAGYGWGAQHWLVLAGLIANALTYGIRRVANWPVLALVLVLCLNLLFGEVHRNLVLPVMFGTLAMLALPFSFTQVDFAPGSRRLCALVIMLTPLVSVAIGAMLQLAGTREVFDFGTWTANRFRLEGATGNAAVFAMLAFAGFVVAVHEITRPGRPYASHLAAINLTLVIFSGTRMAIFVSALFMVVYLAVSASLRATLRAHRRQALLGAGFVGTTFLLYWPTLWYRLFDREDFTSGRGDYWQFYLEEFWLSPVFGRGLGIRLNVGSDWISWAPPVAHNEYLHLLAIGGVVGFALCLVAIILWCRQLWRMAAPNVREFLLALAPALLIYAITDNALTYLTALPVYAYLGMLSSGPPPAARAALEAEAWSAERAQANSS